MKLIDLKYDFSVESSSLTIGEIAAFFSSSRNLQSSIAELMQSVRHGQTFIFMSFNLKIGILPLFDKEKVPYRGRKNTTPW